jgi:2-polyprenyl-3-methyl-5-hydroxy-6-metoxy-1,4-benzoquinol methylase
MSRTIVRLEKVLQNVFVPKRGKLLELGCGTGNVTIWLAARGYFVHGVDISPTAVDYAKEAALRRKVHAEFKVADVTEILDYPEDNFDIVLDSNLFHCIVGDDRQVLLANVKSLLRPNGFFHIGTMCGQVRGEFFKEYYDPRTRCVMTEDGVPLRFVASAEEILDEIKKAGFYILNWEIHPVNHLGNDNDYLEVNVIKP